MCSHDNAVFQSMSLTDVFANSSLPLFIVAFHFLIIPRVTFQLESF